MQTNDFKESLISLLTETYGLSNAPSGFYLDSGDAGLFGQMAKLSPAVASARHMPEHETIAGHCQHLLYTLNVFLAFERGDRITPDWPSSWVPQIVNQAEWDQLQVDLRSAYDTFIENVQNRTEWPKPAIGAGMVMLAHTAYHVGVIDKMITISSN